MKGTEILESYQRWLWRYERPPKRRGEPGKRLGISTQRAKLGTLKDWFSWLVRQNVLLSNPASELELPRMKSASPPKPSLCAKSKSSSPCPI